MWPVESVCYICMECLAIHMRMHDLSTLASFITALAESLGISSKYKKKLILRRKSFQKKLPFF
jgi:hypothetical protein